MVDLTIDATGVVTSPVDAAANTVAANGGTRTFIIFNESEVAIKVTVTGSVSSGAEDLTLSISNGGNDERARHPANRQITMDGYTGLLVQVTNNHTAAQAMIFTVRTLHGTEIGNGGDVLIAHRDVLVEDDAL